MALSTRLARRSPGRPRPPKTPDGRMALVDHLRELRSRMVKGCLAIVVGAVVGWLLYGWLFQVLTEPFTTTVTNLSRERGLNAKLTLNGVGDAFMLQTKVALVAGIVMSSPVWLYQIWAFILPGLHSNERKWTITFAGVAGPLFMGGVLLGYFVLPKGLSILINFTPGGVSNLITVDGYLGFVLRLLLVFGVAFEIPLFVVLLSLAGIVNGARLAKARAWIVLATFIFAAVATPSTDPITMLLLALPMTGLFLLAEVLTHVIDRRRRQRRVEQESYDAGLTP